METESQKPKDRFEDTINQNIHQILKNYIDRIYKHYMNETFRKDVNEQLEKLSKDEFFWKNDDRARRHREKGNAFFKEEKYDRALGEYHEAVMSAELDPVGDENQAIESELSLSLGNRSAVLIRLGDFSRAISDINYALHVTRTEKQRKKLSDRLKHCLSNISLTEEKREDYNLQKVDVSEKIVRKTVHEGDLILCEIASKRVLNEDQYFIYCHNCLRNLPEKRFYTCTTCSQARFCGLECLKEGEKSHRPFCLNLKFIDRANMSRFRVSPMIACLELAELDLDENFSQLRSGKLIERMNNASLDSTSEDLEVLSEVAAKLLVLFADKLNLPPKTPSNSATRRYDIELFSSLIMVYLLTFEARCREIFIENNNLQLSDQTEVKEIERFTIGHGSFDFINSLGHSCEPNCHIDFFDGITAQIRATCDLSPGEKLRIDKGINIKIATVKERKEFLRKNFNVNCECEACMNSRQPDSKAFLCSFCEGKVFADDGGVCADCKKPKAIDIEAADNQARVFLKSMMKANLALVSRNCDLRLAEDTFLEIYLGLKPVLYPVNYQFLQVTHRLSYCYKRMNNFGKAFVYSIKALRCAGAYYYRCDRRYLLRVINCLNRMYSFVKFCVDKERKFENVVDGMKREKLTAVMKEIENDLALCSKYRDKNDVLNFDPSKVTFLKKILNSPRSEIEENEIHSTLDPLVDENLVSEI